MHAHGGQGSSCIAPSGERLPRWIHPFTYTPWACHAAAIGRLRSRDWLYPPMPPCSRRLCRIRQACAHRLSRYLPSLSLCFPLSIRSSFSPLRVHVSIHLPNSSCCSYLLLDAAHLLYPLSLSLSLSLGYQVQVILGATWVGCLTRRTRNTSSKVGQDLK